MSDLSNHKAVVTLLRNVRKHPNADRLQLATVLGNQVIVGINAKENDKGLYFNSDLQLSEEFCQANNLIGYTDPVTGERKGGFFSKNRKVRAQNFRGEKSDGFWCDFSYLESLAPGIKLPDFTELEELDVWNEVPICNKFYTPATLQKIKEGRLKQARRAVPTFPKHVDTINVRKVKELPVGNIIITEKLHGTSGRYGNIPIVSEKRGFFRTLFGLKAKRQLRYEYLNGTRNTVLGNTTASFYADESFRERVVSKLKNNLHKGEIIYYEIVGFAGTAPIMPPVNIVDKNLQSKYGSKMMYSYGCLEGQCEMYVYRIAHTNEDGVLLELSWSQVLARCKELGIKPVPYINPFPETPQAFSPNFLDEDDLLDLENNAEGVSVIDPSHIKEGVVIRIEGDDGKLYLFKIKSFTFKLLEGIIKNDENYVDLEEIS